VAGLALLSLAPAVNAADAKPTHAEIQKARAVCAQHKHKFKAFEKAHAKDPTLAEKRMEWAKSCYQAQDLINAAKGSKAAK